MRAVTETRTTGPGERFAACLFVSACLASLAGCDSLFGTTRSVAKQAKPAEIFVDIDAKGRFRIEKDQLTEDQLLAHLKRASAASSEQTVINRCDEKSPYTAPVAVMNACNVSGIRDYRVAAAPMDGN
jgi:biopolymer transport protein ExbD